MRLMAVVLVGLVAAGCASTPPASPKSPGPVAPTGPPASAAAEVTPTAPVPSRPGPARTVEPTVVPSVAPTGLTAPRPNGFAYVVTDDLRMRSKPEVSNGSVKYEPLLWKGALAWVVEGPVRGSGYDWYRIEPLGEVDLQYHPDPPPEGWVAAAGRDGEPWIADWGSCKAFRTPLETVSDFDYPPQGLIGLSCFGDRTFEFSAMASQWEISCDSTDPELGLEPAWFRSCGQHYVLDGEGGFGPWDRAPLFVTLAPEAKVTVSSAVKSGSWARVRVTGHYDDPRARDCRSEPLDGGASKGASREHAIRSCRSRFVVTGLVG